MMHNFADMLSEMGMGAGRMLMMAAAAAAAWRRRRALAIDAASAL